MYGLKTIEGPDDEPLTLDRVKTHLGIGHAAEDTWCTDAIQAAREATEKYTGRRWMTQTVRLTLRTWPDCLDAGDEMYDAAGAFRFPIEPVQSVESVTWLDDDKDEQTIDADDLDDTGLEFSPPIMGPIGTWPTPGDWHGAIKVEFIAGYGDADDVPAMAKTAMLLAIANWYENRADQNVLIAKGLPPAAKAKLDLLWTGTQC